MCKHRGEFAALSGFVADFLSRRMIGMGEGNSRRGRTDLGDL